MANFDNLSTKILQEEMAAKYEEGFWAGYEAGPNAMLPGWWFTKPPIRWLPYERGYWFGREVRAQEVDR